MFTLPDDFIRHMHTLHGPQEGQAWLDRLPAILAACEQRWDLTLAPHFANLSYHYVAPATLSDGTPVVVKACSPTGECPTEAEALRLFDGHGMVRLLAYDAQDEVMLLEGLVPGTTLRKIEDDVAAISYACDVMRQMWRPVPPEHAFPTVDDWERGFARLRQYYDGGYGPFPPALFDEAERLYAELRASMDEPVLLHGDLHQDNILAAQREPWLGIDPKGLIGEPAYETGSILRNFLPDLLEMPHPGRILARRVDQFSEELGLDRARVRGWGLAQAVLSACWSIEDSGHFNQDVMTCAELLAAIRV
jgi:streptomycin 6-kinase